MVPWMLSQILLGKSFATGKVVDYKYRNDYDLKITRK